MGREMTELKLRVEAKKKELEAKIAQLKADAVGSANDAVDRLQDKLSKLEQPLKNGWESISEDVAERLNDWLSDKDD
jgi:chromosome segregation ATPase